MQFLFCKYFITTDNISISIVCSNQILIEFPLQLIHACVYFKRSTEAPFNNINLLAELI